MKRLISLIIFFGLLIALGSCENKELREQNLALQSELDSISIILDDTEKAVNTLSEIEILLDTIELQRNMMRMEMVEGGIQYDNYVDRIKALNNYMEQAEDRIAKLEKSGRSSASLVKKLRAEIEEKNQQIASLEKIMEDYKAENHDLKGKIIYQQGEIEDLQFNIDIAQEELDALETKIQKMVEVSAMTEADGYFARAVAYEEAANRTKLAPKKKKATLKQALELYQKASDMGNADAKAKIDELSPKVE